MVWCCSVLDGPMTAPTAPAELRWAGSALGLGNLSFASCTKSDILSSRCRSAAEINSDAMTGHLYDSPKQAWAVNVDFLFVWLRSS